MSNKYHYKIAIVELIGRRGKLDKDGVLTGICQNLGIAIDDYNLKTFYRHMSELVDEHKLECEDTGFPKKRYWYIPGQGNGQVPNGKLVEEHKALFHIPVPSQTFINNFSVSTGALSHDHHDTIYVYFNLNNDFFCLRVLRDAIPFKIHLARVTDEPKSSVVRKVSEAHGGRCITLHLPISKLSSMKEDANTGHALLEFGMDELKISDLNSSNGSGATHVSYEQAEQFIKAGDLIGRHTVSEEWLATGIGSVTFESLEPRGSLIVQYPAVTEFSSDFKILVFFNEV